MLSSSSFNHNPIPNFKPFAENDISFSTSKLDQDPYNSSFLFSLPNSPLMHLEYQDAYLQFLELFYQDHHQSITTTDANPEITAMAADSNENEVLVNQDAAVSNGKATSTTMSKANHQTGRCSKKDRHSKINTARGPRDRRMRLSLDIARKFFDLQDLLGYDKASRTVDWLLRNSRPAIRELARGRAGTQINHPSSDQSSTCEEADCEVVSSTAEEAAPSSVAPFSCTKVKRSKKVKRVESRAISVVARESRRKARERARERTSQKRRLIVSEEAKIYGDQSLVNFSQESHVHIYGVQADAAGRAEDYLSSDEAARIQQVCTAPWNPSTVFDYEEDNNAAFLHQDEQIAEFQLISGKPWEALNSFNLSG